MGLETRECRAELGRLAGQFRVREQAAARRIYAALPVQQRQLAHTRLPSRTIARHHLIAAGH